MLQGPPRFAAVSDLSLLMTKIWEKSAKMKALSRTCGRLIYKENARRRQQLPTGRSSFTLPNAPDSKKDPELKNNGFVLKRRIALMPLLQGARSLPQTIEKSIKFPKTYRD